MYFIQHTVTVMLECSNLFFFFTMPSSMKEMTDKNTRVPLEQAFKFNVDRKVSKSPFSFFKYTNAHLKFRTRAVMLV